jgi:hypothetical protein
MPLHARTAIGVLPIANADKTIRRRSDPAAFIYFGERLAH